MALNTVALRHFPIGGKNPEGRFRFGANRTTQQAVAFAFVQVAGVASTPFAEERDP